jgi:hypothetical protein
MYSYRRYICYAWTSICADYNSTTSKKQATRAVQALDTLVKPKDDAETNNKLEKLRILLPKKSDEQLMVLLEVF